MELRPEGLGLNQCFTTSLATLRKSMTLSDISYLTLKIRLPSGPVAKTALPMQGVQVQSGN